MRTRIPIGVLAAGAATLIATAIAAAPASAQNASGGSLDPTFGTGGVATVPTDFGVGTMLTQPDGTILAEGTVTNAATGDAEFGVVSYNANGTLDTSFGTDGQAVASFPGVNAEPSSIFVQSDGNIVVAGTEDGNPAVAEFNANGTLDTSFGSGGEATTHFPSGSATSAGTDSVNTVLVQADGEILIGGGLVTCGPKKTPCVADYALALFEPDGTLDASFGSGGFAVQKAGSNSDGVIALGEDAAGDIFVQNNNTSDTIGDLQPTLGEYSPAGVPDSTVTFPSSSSITVSSTGVGFQPNGTYPVGQMVSVITAIGHSTYDVQVELDSLPAGAASASFNSSPFAYASGVAANTVSGTVVGSNGDVDVYGSTCALFKHGVCQNGQLSLAQLTPTGSLDSTFGTDGVTTIPVNSSDFNALASLATQPDGDILVGVDSCSTDAQGAQTCSETIERLLG
jgi:uncharacterized delta-60 repeat protein